MILVYAKKELEKYLNRHTNCIITQEDNALRCYVLDVIPTIEAHVARIRYENRNHCHVVFIEGGSESAVLQGIYYMLTKMGIHFDIDGETMASPMDMTLFDNREDWFRPFVRNRGIRQHINFPMDISSYSIGEAKEYIRNLARMNMNAITFHSYTGQWHGYQTSETTILAGNFFYGQRYYVPKYDKEIQQMISNDNLFCIPEVEAISLDGQKRAEFAKNWLNKLMETAKQAGLKITMSMECETDETHQTILATVRGILIDYPLIDSVELITPEGGGQGKELTSEGVIHYIRECFGENSLADIDTEALMNDIPNALSGTLLHLHKAYLVCQDQINLFQGITPKELQVGLYVTCNKTLKLASAIMKNIFPAEVKLTYLSAHGSLAVADNIEYMEFNQNDWQRTMLYSWIEFDGNMYLQQNSCNGIEKLIFDGKKTGADSIYGLCLNHWRTEENKITISYSAYSMVEPIRVIDYYRHYAKQMQIKNADDFIHVETRLAELDRFNRDSLFNIGFCYLGCWLMFKGLKWIRDWKEEHISYAIHEYESINRLIEAVLSTVESQNGRFYLRFLHNRNCCSVYQIQLIQELQKIGKYAVDDLPQKLSEGEKKMALASCERAMELSSCYISKHIEYMPDRGCEGTLISYYNTIPVYIEHIKEYFVYGEVTCKHVPESFDQPPSPDKTYLG